MTNSTVDRSPNEKERTELLRNMQTILLSRHIIYDRIEFAEEVNTCFVFVSTRNVSAVDIPPLEEVAKQVSAKLKAVVDSAEDQLCFFLVFSENHL